MHYNKLVRDKIPAIIQSNGATPITHIATDEEFRIKLDEKLQEEVQEFLASHALEELADILEVIQALSKTTGHTLAELEAVRATKAAERGTFSQHIILDETTK